MLVKLTTWVVFTKLVCQAKSLAKKWPFNFTNKIKPNLCSKTCQICAPISKHHSKKASHLVHAKKLLVKCWWWWNWHVMLDFTNILPAAFTRVDPKSIKRRWWLDCFLGPTCVQGTLQMLVKLTRGRAINRKSMWASSFVSGPTETSEGIVEMKCLNFNEMFPFFYLDVFFSISASFFFCLPH